MVERKFTTGSETERRDGRYSLLVADCGKRACQEHYHAHSGNFELDKLQTEFSTVNIAVLRARNIVIKH